MGIQSLTKSGKCPDYRFSILEGSKRLFRATVRSFVHDLYQLETRNFETSNDVDEFPGGQLFDARGH